jgi:phosphoenolpyruvate-protein phosphotransferase (PTS system enzyme I)
MRSKKVPQKKKELVLQGIAASPGIAIGPALLVANHSTSYKEPSDQPVPVDQVDVEIDRFNKALELTREDLLELQKRVRTKLENRDVSIFDAHLLIIEDQMLMTEVEDLIRRKLKSAEYAFFKVINRYITAISAMPDEYIRERSDDIKDVSSRVLAHMNERRRPILDHLDGRKVILAADLTPSDTALLDRKNVMGFAICAGSRTSHTAILARSLGIPAVVCVKGLLDKVQADDFVIIDGSQGKVIINPGPEVGQDYLWRAAEDKKFYDTLASEKQLEAKTTDDVKVHLLANIETTEDVKNVKRFGCEGIGLFRTEFLYMAAEALPSEEKQYDIYRRTAEAMHGKTVIIRTLDIGGDKYNSNIIIKREANPFMGLRAIRLCLQEYPEIFRTQLRAIMRAGTEGNIKIMLPMITCMEEVKQTKELILEVSSELQKEGVKHKNDIELGIMIETPAAVMLAPELAQEVDFFSIGTNDLIQYSMAVDRGNEKVTYLYRPMHPAILRMIKHTVKAGNAANIPTAICGEMAGDPRTAMLVIGLGIRELSMIPLSVTAVRRIIRGISLKDLQAAADEALLAHSADKAEKVVTKLLEGIAPEIVNLAMHGL